MRGQCLCGSVSFEVSVAAPRLYQCHCSLCRKQGGSASNTAAIVGAGNFRWLGGQAQVSSWVKETGFRSDFCAICGSPVPNPLRGTSYYWVPAGLLDDDRDLEIRAHFYVDSKASWDAIAPQGIRHAQAPALFELIALLAPQDTAGRD
jgi:hypothetical protein